LRKALGDRYLARLRVIAGHCSTVPRKSWAADSQNE